MNCPALSAAICMFFFVGLKAFQSRNVNLDWDTWVIPLAVIIAPFELGLYVSAVEGRDLATALGMGLGGGLGALAAMRLHRHLGKWRS